MKTKTPIACFALILSLAAPACAGVETNVAPSGVTIQSSGSLNAFTTASRVIDGLTNEGPTGASGYWLAPAGKTTGYFILDLMGEYPVTSVALYNTHGGNTEDSGTAKFAVSASDTVGPAVVGLDRYYPFNGNLNDYSTNAVNAVEVDPSFNVTTAVYSNLVPASVKGLTESLSLSGYGESVEIVDPAGFVQPTVYSYAMWVECQTNYWGFLQATSFILRTAKQGNERSTWSHQLRLNAAMNFEAYTYDGALKTVSGTTVVQPNVWYHVAVTAQNGGMMHLYVNGVEEGTPVAIATLWQGGGMTEIGTGSGGGFQPSSELLSDVGIWYSLLSPADIASLATGQPPTAIGAAAGLTLINPKAVVSGTLSNVTGQTNITPNVYNLSIPVTARYWRFDALSCEYTPAATNSVGLDEIQLFANVSVPALASMPAVELNWPANPFAAAPLTSTNLLSANWVPVSPAPTLTGTNFTVFQTATNAAAFYQMPGPANGAAISTNVAMGGNIIYASSYYTSPSFLPSHVIDGVTDESTNACPMPNPSYWLAVDGDTNASFILDLQRSYSITSVSLFNTHNGQCDDRGTAQFELNAIDGITTNQVQAEAVDRYYPFDGDLTDHSGNNVNAVLLDGPNGSVISGTYSANVPAVLGGGESIVLSQNGDRIEIDDYTNATTGLSLEPTAYSISLWINLSNVGEATSIIVRTDGSGSESNTYSHQIRMLPSGQFETYLWIGSPATVIGTTVAQPNTWYHVVATAQNGDWMHLYVNGKEEGAPAPVGTMWNGGDRWTLGTGSGDGTGVVPGFVGLAGDVDSLGIWFSVISAEQVQALYTGTKPTAIAGTTNVVVYPNPRSVAAGTLSDVVGEYQIIPDVFPVSPPVTARYLRFQALSSIAPTGYIGLNEIQVYAEAGAPRQSISHAVLLTWPYSPFSLVLQSSPDAATWTTVPAQPTLVGLTWQIFQPAGLYYRLSAP